MNLLREGAELPVGVFTRLFFPGFISRRRGQRFFGPALQSGLELIGVSAFGDDLAFIAGHPQVHPQVAGQLLLRPGIRINLDPGHSSQLFTQFDRQRLVAWLQVGQSRVDKVRYRHKIPAQRFRQPLDQGNAFFPKQPRHQPLQTPGGDLSQSHQGHVEGDTVALTGGFKFITQRVFHPFPFQVVGVLLGRGLIQRPL